MVYRYDWATEADTRELTVYVDTDFAVCKETRRSTSGGVCLLAGSCIKAWSKTQTTIALSSGEAELHGICMGITQALGLQSVARDLGFTLDLNIHSDATAAIGICRRRGMGKIRHLDVEDLWCQDKVRSGAVSLHKVLGAENPADIMTKYSPRDVLDKMLKKIGMVKSENVGKIFIFLDKRRNLAVFL